MIEIKNILEGWISDGFSEGELSVDPYWYVLWSPSQVEKFNQDYELKRYAPGFVAFGSNGGGELLVIDNKGSIFYLPCVGMQSESAIKITENIQQFKNHMQN